MDLDVRAQTLTLGHQVPHFATLGGTSPPHGGKSPPVRKHLALGFKATVAPLLRHQTKSMAQCHWVALMGTRCHLEGLCHAVMVSVLQLRGLGLGLVLSLGDLVPRRRGPEAAPSQRWLMVVLVAS